MKYHKLIILFVFVLAPVIASAGLREQGDSAYQAKNYAEAIKFYTTLENEQGVSANLLYNLGNAYYLSSDYGHAMLCYERAYKLDPHNSQISSNLLYLKSKVDDANKAEQKGKKLKVEEDEPTFFQTVHKAIAVEIKSDRWAVWGVVSFFLFLFCLGVYIFTKGVIFRKIGFFGGFVCLGMTVICIIFGSLGALEFNKHESGVIVAYKVPLHLEPSADKSKNTELVLTKGTKVRVIAEETDASGNIIWYKVRLNSDFIGWVEEPDLEII